MNWLKKILIHIKNKRSMNKLPIKNGQLDVKYIVRIWILTDPKGKPILVLAEGPSGELFCEDYSANLNSLILSSGIPCQTVKASTLFGRYLLIAEMKEKEAALEDDVSLTNKKDI